jgi:hypothetical protein
MFAKLFMFNFVHFTLYVSQVNLTQAFLAVPYVGVREGELVGWLLIKQPVDLCPSK